MTRAEKEFKKRFAGLEVVTVFEDREEDVVHVATLPFDSILCVVKNSRYFEREHLLIKTVKELLPIILDAQDATAIFLSADWKKRQEEERRQRLEGFAAQIARSYRIKAYSPEFIEACHSELARFQDYREGMREDGLCIGWGVTPEQWFDEFNESQGDSARIHELLDWLEEKCPLLMAQYHEGQARRA